MTTPLQPTADPLAAWQTPLRIVSFVGAPGSGKSTQIRLLSTALGARCIVASVPKLARRDPSLLAWTTPDERKEIEQLIPTIEKTRATGVLAPLALDRILLQCIRRIPPECTVLLDGCPRGPEPARFYCAACPRESTLVLHLAFASDEIHNSLRRQYVRAEQRVGSSVASSDMGKFWQKLRVYRDQTRPGLDILRSTGLPVATIDADAPRDVVQRLVWKAVARGVSPVPHGPWEKSAGQFVPGAHAEMHRWRSGRLQMARCDDQGGWNSLLSSARS